MDVIIDCGVLSWLPFRQSKRILPARRLCSIIETEQQVLIEGFPDLQHTPGDYSGVVLIGLYSGSYSTGRQRVPVGGQKKNKRRA